MAKCELVICFILFGSMATAIAQTASGPEAWPPINPVGKTITGRVTLTPSEIVFRNGASMSLARGGQMLFRPAPKQRDIMADLYKVARPDDSVLENGNKLCKGKAVAYLIVWKSDKTGKEIDPRTLAPLSGPKLNSGSTDDCGRYTYDAGSH